MTICRTVLYTVLYHDTAWYHYDIKLLFLKNKFMCSELEHVVLRIQIALSATRVHLTHL